jgi:hypothetical protein
VAFGIGNRDASWRDIGPRQHDRDIEVIAEEICRFYRLFAATMDEDPTFAFKCEKCDRRTGFCGRSEERGPPRHRNFA